MKKSVFYIVIMILLCGCSHKVYEGTRWQEKHIMVDGLPQEWSLPLRYYDESSELNYQISNDRENLYIAVRTINKATAQQILIGGLHFELDTLLKGDYFPYGVRFPAFIEPISGPEKGHKPGQGKGTEGQAGQMPPKGNSAEAKPDRNPSNIEVKMSMDTTIEIKGFGDREDIEEVVPFSEASGILASLNMGEDNSLFMEIQIPLKTFYKDLLVPNDANRVFRFLITLDENAYPGGEESEKKPQGPPAGGSGMGSGSGMGGSPGGMGGGPGGMGGVPGMGGGPGMSGGPGMEGGSAPGQPENSKKGQTEILQIVHLSYR